MQKINDTSKNRKALPPCTTEAGAENPPAEHSVSSAGAVDRSEESLPCLYSNNSIENTKYTSEQDLTDCTAALCGMLTPYHKRQAEALFLNVKRLVEKEAPSPGHIGFLTLTFPDNVTDNKEASRRFNSLKTNFLAKHPEIGHWLSVKEQQSRGAWHYHLLVVLKQDIKTGVDFQELRNGKYTSASPYLRNIWKDLREAMPKYNFGRSELLPIRKNGEAMARYVGKYISKHIGQRNDESKGVRLISSSRGWAKNSCKFSWNTPNAKDWRKKLRLFAKLHGCSELYQLNEKLGPGWAYKYTQDIMDIYERYEEIRDKERTEYTPPLVENAKSRKVARHSKMRKDLVLHSGKSARQLQQETERIQFKASITSKVKTWVKVQSPQTTYEDQFSIESAIRQAYRHMQERDRLQMVGKAKNKEPVEVPF